MFFNSMWAGLGLASLMAAQTATAPPPSQAPSGNLPVSISRIRNALKKPEGLRVRPAPRADFKVEINEAQRFRDLLDLLDFGSGPVAPGGWYAFQQRQLLGQQQSQPLVSFDAGAMGQAVGSAIANARRARAERLARDEVQRALIEFCATHECPAR
jgi:hypothetical protein